MAYTPKNANGQATMANSAPVTIASDQSALPITDNSSSLSVDWNGTQPVTGSGTATGALRVELPTNGTGVIATVTAVTGITNALPAGTNAIGKLAANSGVDIGDVDITSVTPGTTATSLGKAEDAQHTTGDVGVMALGVRAASPTERSAGPSDGDYEPFATNEVGAMWVSPTPSANGGLSVFSLVSAATTNATNIKATPGNVYGWYIYNSNAAARKLVFHNTAGTPTAGASVFFSLVIPPSSGANVEITNGIQFSTGIGITTVTGLAANDSAAVALNDLIITIFYK